MTAPEPTAPDGLREALAKRLFLSLCPYATAETLDALWGAPECFGYRRSASAMADGAIAGPLKPILDALAASREAEARAQAERDEARAEVLRLCDIVMDGQLTASEAALDARDLAEANLLDLARMYGEACGRLAEYRHAAVEWQQEQAEYKAFHEAALAAANARAERLAEALRPFVAHRAWARRHEWPVDIANDPSTPILGTPGDEGIVNGEVTVGHFDAAATALAEPAAETQETRHGD